MTNTDWEKIVQFWLDEAGEALRVADHLFEKGDYSYSLFFGHLGIEKFLKAVYVSKKRKHAPPVHNLERLAVEAALEMTVQKRDLLIRVTAYNIEARYPDIHRSFREKCTADFTGRELNEIKEFIQWLQSITIH
ncbi:MAG TPA: HEPN domain-containing protein [Spirochaetota bacterium]|nr:HEPN domain-containing protein [Spirochaetota bacterium]HQP48898.1 HEPN domain-containing protein [Spirochaetota bacterium]